MDANAQALLLNPVSDRGPMDRERPHYREFRRRVVNIRADLRLCAPDGKLLDEGSATVGNISASGALLADVSLKSGSLPVGPSVLHVTMRDALFDGVTIACRPVRPAPECSGYGVRIMDIHVPLEAEEQKGGKRRRSARVRRTS